MRRELAECIVKRCTYSASDPAASAALVKETRDALLRSPSASICDPLVALGYAHAEIDERFDCLLPHAARDELASAVRVEVGWTRSECRTIARLLASASDAHSKLLDLEPAGRCARLRVRWLRLLVDGDRAREVLAEDERDKLRQRALASLRRESKHARKDDDWHRLDAVLEDVLRDLRERCDGDEAALHEIERWMDWLDRFVLPLVAVRSKSLSLATLDETTLDLLDAMRGSVSGSNSVQTHAVRAWVRAGMPDTSSK